MKVTVGLQHAGSFQVSGWPYLNETTLNTTEQEFTFNFISQEVTVWNAGAQTLKFYYTSGSGNVFELPAGKKVTMRVKAGSIFAKSSTGTTTIKLFVSMTNIPLERIGTIPTGSYFGPAGADLDGDGTPDIFDPFIKMFGGDWPDAAEGASGDNNLWMEYTSDSGEVMEYSADAGGSVIPDTLYFIDCPGSIDSSDFDPIMENLTAHYVNYTADPPVEVDFTSNIVAPVQSDVDLTKQNEDQFVPITVERSFTDPSVLSVTVYLKVHIVCPDEGDLPECGDELDGDFEEITYGYPTAADETTTDPAALDASLWVCDDD